MRFIREATLDETIATFLRHEMHGRFGDKIDVLIARESIDRNVVMLPNVLDPIENELRRAILARYRGYVFEELPGNTEWHWVELTKDELVNVRYIDYSYWNELSRNTRLATVGAHTIQTGERVMGEPLDVFIAAAQALRGGAQFPPMILVAASRTAPITVFEGHVRLTAYMLAPECIPNSVLALIGYAPEMGRL